MTRGRLARSEAEVQPRIARDLAPDLEKALLMLGVGELSLGREGILHARNRYLFRGHPGVKVTADRPHVRERARRALRTPRERNEPDHFPLEVLEAEQVDGVLERARNRPVVFGRAEDDPVRGADGPAHAIDVGRVGTLVLPLVAE